MAKPRRKKRTHQVVEVDPSKKPEPKSFVFRRGRHGMVLHDLEKDMRKLMMPNTALNLKESKSNTLKDFVNVAGPLGVTHFLMLTATDNASYLKIAKSPRGPTISMRIHTYSLMRDVLGAQQKPHCPPEMFLTPPLVVMNNFGAAEELKLAATMFQNLFPSINVSKVKLKTCQRVVLLNHNPETGRISFRHYHIGVQPSGVSKGIRNLVQRKSLPDMSNMADVSEFIAKAGYGSESEGEEAAESRITLAQDMGKGNLASKQSRVKLHEVGPRLELEVIKVEEGLGDGKVIFHKYVSKSETEVAALGQAKSEKVKLKEERRRQQEENVRRKKAEREAKEATKKRGKGGKAEEGGEKVKRKKMWWEEEMEDARQARQEREMDDDAEYYREEVGEEPDATFKRGQKPSRTTQHHSSGKASGGSKRKMLGNDGSKGARGPKQKKKK